VLLWARTLRAWHREILGHLTLPITNGFTEGCHTKIKLLKRLSYGYRNVQVSLRKMLLGFLPVSHAVLAPHLSS
jgi:transposase